MSFRGARNLAVFRIVTCLPEILPLPELAYEAVAVSPSPRNWRRLMREDWQIGLRRGEWAPAALHADGW